MLLFIIPKSLPVAPCALQACWSDEDLQKKSLVVTRPG